ncbi:MAG: hypothetical protein GHCLOJNM_04592 [bacterium]|nr:hypothetical protein [bacterium]
MTTGTSVRCSMPMQCAPARATMTPCCVRRASRYALLPLPASGVAGDRRQEAVRWPLAAAAAGVGLAVVFGWQLFEQRRATAALQAELADLTLNKAALERQVVDLEQQQERLAGAPQGRDPDRSAPAEIPQVPPSPLPAATVPATAVVLASVILTPGLVRGGDGIERIDLPPGSGTVRLQLDLATVSAHPRYDVELHDMRGAVLLRQPQLRPRATTGGRIVSIDVPSQLLASGEYELLLTNAAGTGAADDPIYYHFAVRRQ